MRTQGISLLMGAGDTTTSMQSTKASDSTFDSFMSNHASKVSQEISGKEALSVRTNDVEPHRFDTKATGRMAKESNLTSAKAETDKTVETVDMSELTAQAKAALQKIFGLSEEELTDVMEQLGIQIQDLLFQIENGTIVPINVNAMQEFVLGVHGIEDTAAILTNDALSQELCQMTEALTAILAEGFGVEPEEVAGLQQNLLLDFAEQMQQAEGKKAEELTGLLPDAEMADGETVDSTSLVVETQQESTGNGDSAADLMKGEMAQTTDALPQTTSVGGQAAATFTANLTQALEQVSSAEELSANQTMIQIVEQVVRQVRIRVMPETTSMEMQLNPANLGRVHLTVATNGAIATATMVVENQMAKNALESQMLTLKETFAEQGLKVEEVEVTVAEFGLKKENQQQQEATGGRRQNRRFRADREMTEEEDSLADTNVTASERRDANSMVDYTA